MSNKTASEFFMPITPRDWVEDFSGENGQYQCWCTTCEKLFVGHKRRVTCKVCAVAATAYVKQLESNPAPSAPEDVREIAAQIMTSSEHRNERGGSELRHMTLDEAAALIQAHITSRCLESNRLAIIADESAQKLIKYQDAKLADLTAKVERMREALSPFMQEAAARGWLFNHDGSINEINALCGIGGSNLRNKDLYRAYIAALADEAVEK